MKPDGALRASEWTVDVIPFDTARSLVLEHHYSRSTGNTATVRHGLLNAANVAVGAAIWIPPTKSAAQATLKKLGRDPSGWGGVLSLSRLAIAPEAPPNAASFLLGRSMKAIDRIRWPVFVTYADTRMGHTGAIYRATNWQDWGPVPAGDIWIGPNGEQRGRKRGPRTYTRQEMFDLGFTPGPRFPKIKFVHEARR